MNFPLRSNVQPSTATRSAYTSTSLSLLLPDFPCTPITAPAIPFAFTSRNSTSRVPPAFVVVISMPFTLACGSHRFSFRSGSNTCPTNSPPYHAKFARSSPANTTTRAFSGSTSGKTNRAPCAITVVFETSRIGSFPSNRYSPAGIVTTPPFPNNAASLAPSSASAQAKAKLIQATKNRRFISLETEMERDEDGVVLGSTRLPGSQRLHR